MIKVVLCVGNCFSRIINDSHKFSGKLIEGYNDKHDENKKIDDSKDILATPNDKEKLTCNECDFTMLQNQALKSYNIKVIDMKEMISVNNVDIKHPRKMTQKYI